MGETRTPVVDLHVDPPALRAAALPARRRGAPGVAGRRERHHEVRDRAAPPALRRAVRHPRSAPCASPTCSGLVSASRDDFQGFLPIFVRRALSGEPIRVFGDGAQERDCLYVDDVVECLVRLRARPRRTGEVFNVGNDEQLSLREIAEVVVAAAGSGSRGVGAVAGGPRRDRHRLVLRRLVEGEAGARLGVSRRRSPTASGTTIDVLPDCTSSLPVTTRTAAPPGRRPRPPDRRAPSPSSSRRSTAVLRSGVFLLGPETEAFESEFAAFCGRRHAVAVASGTEALRLALVAHGRGRGRRGRSCPRSRPCPTAAAVCATGAVPVFADVDRETATLDVAAAAAARHRPHPRRDPGAPVRPAGRDPRSRRPRARGRGAGARRARSAAPSVGGGVQLLSDEEPRRDRRRRRRGHRRRRRSPRRSGCCAATASRDGYEHTAVTGNSRLSEVEAAALRVGLRRLAGGNARRQAIAARVPRRGARPALAGAARAARVPLVRGAGRRTGRRGGPPAVRDRACTTRGRSRSSRRTSEFVRDACPEAEAWAAECVSLPCFPEMTDDEIEAVCRALQ